MADVQFEVTIYEIHERTFRIHTAASADEVRRWVDRGNHDCWMPDAEWVDAGGQIVGRTVQSIDRIDNDRAALAQDDRADLSNPATIHLPPAIGAQDTIDLDL